MRPIDADELKKAIELLCEDERTNMTAIAYFALRELVDTMPTIEAEPVKHGRWVEKEAYEEDRQMGFNFQIVCSNCDEQNSVLYSFDENSEPTEKYFMRTPWCPWCGAKMDLKDGDSDGR